MCEVSHSAGTFVCNQVFFALMHRLRAWPQAKGGFIHLPPLPEHVALHPGGRPMALDEQVRPIELAAAVALTRPAAAQWPTGCIDQARLCAHDLAPEIEHFCTAA